MRAEVGVKVERAGSAVGWVHGIWFSVHGVRQGSFRS
jgi:hypothetical protein